MRALRHALAVLLLPGVVVVLVPAILVWFGSVPLFAWFAFVGAVNAIYMPLVEEPALVRRYGEEYERYRRHVPRWVPSARPWHPSESGDQPPP